MYDKKEKKKINEYLKAKQFCYTQIWIVQLPSLFNFFVKEQIFGSKKVRTKRSSMQWFCEEMLKVDVSRSNIMPLLREEFRFVITGNEDDK